MEQSKTDYKYLLPLHKITALRVRKKKTEEKFPELPDSEMNQLHYHGGLQQQGSPFSEREKKSVEKSILQNRSRFTGGFWLGYRVAEREERKKERKLWKGERSSENCKEGETEQKCRVKKENYNQAKGQKKAKEEEIAPLLNPGQARLRAFKSFGASMCLLSLIFIL